VELWGFLLPILFADAMNPVLLGALVYALGTARPLALSSALLLGHTATYFGSGVVLALGIEAVAERLENPKPIDFGIEFVVGVALLAIGFAMLRGKHSEQRFGEEEGAEPGLLSAFTMGAILNLIGIPFAVPYFAAIAQMLKADLTTAGVLGAIVAYNLLYALPFALVIAVRSAFGTRVDAPLRTLNAWMERGSAVLVPLLLLAVGGFFVVEAIWFFLRDEPILEL